MGCRPTPLPLDCQPLYIGICACACLCLALQSHKRKVTFTPRYLFPLRFSFFRVLPKASAVPLRFMESRERCFLPVLLCAGPGAAGLGVGGARLSSQERRRLARPLHSDSLPEHTQIRGKKGEWKGTGSGWKNQKATLVRLIPAKIQLLLTSLYTKRELWLNYITSALTADSEAYDQDFPIT